MGAFRVYWVACAGSSSNIGGKRQNTLYRFGDEYLPTKLFSQLCSTYDMALFLPLAFRQMAPYDRQFGDTYQELG